MRLFILRKVLFCLDVLRSKNLALGFLTSVSLYNNIDDYYWELYWQLDWERRHKSRK